MAMVKCWSTVQQAYPGVPRQATQGLSDSCHMQIRFDANAVQVEHTI